MFRCSALSIGNTAVVRVCILTVTTLRHIAADNCVWADMLITWDDDSVVAYVWSPWFQLCSALPAMYCSIFPTVLREREQAWRKLYWGRRELGKEEGGSESDRTEKEIKKDKERRRETCLFWVTLQQGSQLYWWVLLKTPVEMFAVCLILIF